MRATRHNGRAGKHGAYNPKHNDRDFDVEHADHIDTVRAEGNVYWDCYQGYCLPGSGQERQFTFSEIEKIYYQEHYGDHIDAQNERNEAARHPERNRSAEDVLKNTKTCPEETILQLGNIDGTIPASTFAQISAEYFEEFEKRFGSHIHILDWALHLDETTPHIHERHVFDAENRYGEICPQQDKALEELGFELPDPEKPKGRYNNRKMSFDAECRNIFLEICKKHGIEVEMEPVYGGVSYLEKADYIVKKLREENAKLTAENQELKLEHDELVVKVSDLDALVENVSEIANGYHFTISERAKQNLEDSKIEGNSVVAFLNSDGYIGFDKDSAITTKDFFDVYYRWCDENAEVPCKNPASFSKKVKEVAKKYGIEPIQNVLNTEGMKVRGYRGVYIKVRDSENPFLKAS